jgi:hypothetical protein
MGGLGDKDMTKFCYVALIALALPEISFAQFVPLMDIRVRTSIPAVIQCPGCNNEDKQTRSAGNRLQPRAIAATEYVFRPQPQLRRSNLANFVEKSRAVDPTGAAKMEQLFASTDIIGMIDQRMQQTYGMRANNVADAYAVWWVSAWMGSQGRSDDATPGQMAMVKRQATNALASTPEFVSATDATKQEMAEAMLVQAAMIGEAVDAYKSDPAMLAKARASIKQGAKAMGLDLGAMTLTDQGFVPARKTGAADANPTAPDAQLASAVPTTNDNDSPYLLMAAAGAAGIGGVFMLGKMMGRRG